MIKDKIKHKLQTLNVLFVDDEEFVVETMKDILPILFKNAYFAINGIDGIKIVKEHKVDIVITDLSMPKMDGIEMLENIKLIDPDIKSICVSGHNDINFLEKAKDLKSEYIIKPINSIELFKALEKII
ncbi:MAG: response regulator [Campylobacterota bacterium]|nr:response regulator [Campylobacterota bacterium]